MTLASLNVACSSQIVDYVALNGELFGATGGGHLDDEEGWGPGMASPRSPASSDGFNLVKQSYIEKGTQTLS